MNKQLHLSLPHIRYWTLIPWIHTGYNGWEFTWGPIDMAFADFDMDDEDE
jgi:hypothetical protein